MVVDQLRVEQKGIPTVTIVTNSYEELAKDTIAGEKAPVPALVVVPHPIAGHKLDGLRTKVDGEFPEILKAATSWQPGQ